MFIITMVTGGPGSATQSSTHAPRRQNTIDSSSSTKENVISGRKTPSNAMESPKVVSYVDIGFYFTVVMIFLSEICFEG